MRRQPLILLAAFQAALAQSPAGEPPAPEPGRQIPNYLLISKKADVLLQRENGSHLEIDELPPNTLRNARALNRVLWHSSTKDQRLVSIVIRPVGAEAEGTTILTAALLVSVSAVENLDEGIRMALAVKQAHETDGRPRQVQLANGVKLLRVRTENEPAEFQIRL